ncbi:MAG: DegT/DnrJ/EryC1/StrS family aminotransferase [Pyrinomonadaceae bacterium]
MPISFIDLKQQHKEIEVELKDALSRVLSGGIFCIGPEVEAFEEDWARFCDVQSAASVACGTDAITLALVASGAVRKGQEDEVIVPALTAGYTALAVLNAGGVPVFADIDPQTYTLDPNTLEEAISPRTRAIVPVHLYGQMADMPAICDVAGRHSLVVVEDAAQSHGARLNGKSAGAFGHAAAYSFYPTKNLGACGDGGAVVSNDVALIERVKTLRQSGHPAAMQGETEGRNSRLDEIQAALLRVKLKRLADWNRQRQKLAGIYCEMLQAATRLRLPHVRQPEAHVFHLYVVEHSDRDNLRANLAASGIDTMIHYPFLLHQQKLFRRNVKKRLSVAERVVGRMLSLPLYPQLSEDDVRSVASTILEFETRANQVRTS